VEWVDLTFYGRPGPGHRYTFRELEGWEGWDAVWRGGPRARPHGAHGDGADVPARTLPMPGLCAPPEGRAAPPAASADRFVPAKEPLRVTHGGRRLTAEARLVRWRPVAVAWGAGFFAWEAQWVCPDPLRYGPLQSVTTGFPELVGGLRYPLYTDGAGA